MQNTFKRGDTVTLQLTADHELEGDLQDHSARFIRVLPGQDWAEVQLTVEHAGGVKTLHVPLDTIEAAQ